MAAGQERALRRRIRSVNSTRKITRAMELIASSRIARAQHAIAAARPYVEAMTALLDGLADNMEARRHPVFNRPEHVSKVAVVVVAADRGLCGAYNSNVLRQAERLAESHRRERREVEMVLVGRKAQSYFRYRGWDTKRSFVGVTDKPTFSDAQVIAQSLLQVMGAVPGGDGEGTDPVEDSARADLVQIVFTRFRSLGSQEVVTEQVFPVQAGSHRHDEEETGSGGSGTGFDSGTESVSAEQRLSALVDYDFEPEAPLLLDTLVPKVVETRVFGALLDASASEHASRQRAMKAATDNADEFVKVLTRQMNRARQDSITTEIMEIVGGAEALSQAS